MVNGVIGTVGTVGTVGTASQANRSGPVVRLFASGTEIGRRYEVRTVLGQGGTAVVYAAWDRELKRNVALKVLRSDRMTESSLKRFRREVAVARDADSQRLVRVYDIGESGESVFLTMELVEGESLRDRIARGPIPVEEAVRLAGEVLEALAVLHGLGIVHRDVKPGNVLLAPGGSVKIADFGLARHLEGTDTRATEPEALVGTMEYISPEQALGKEVDARSDLYSLGILLFEMLAGRAPFESGSALGAVVARLKRKAPDVRSRAPATPRWLASVISRLLEVEPARRYASAEAVLLDLSRRRFFPTWRQLRVPAAAAAAGTAALGLVVAATFLVFGPWGSRELPRLVVDGKTGMKAVDAAGRVLWRRPDVSPVSRTAFVRFPPRGEVRLAAILQGDDDLDPQKSHILSILDPRTGKVQETHRLVDPGSMLREFANTYSISSVLPVDVDGDGIDEIAISYVHRPLWPSYVLLFEPKTAASRPLFFHSGHGWPLPPRRTAGWVGSRRRAFSGTPSAPAGSCTRRRERPCRSTRRPGFSRSPWARRRRSC